MDSISKMATCGKIDPYEFDITISALLIGLGADKYVDVFRKHNIGQCTLLELTDEDLALFGIDDPEIRKKLLREVQNLPISKEILETTKTMFSNLNQIEISEILEETSQHLYRIYLSMLANCLVIKKTKKINDILIYKDQYASDIAIETLNEINNIVNSMDITLHTQMKAFNKTKKSVGKKVLVGSVGSVVIGVLAVLFVKSLRQLHQNS